MSRTPQGAPGSIIYQGKFANKIGHAAVDRRDNTYIAMFDGVFLGRFDYPEDAIEVVMDRGRAYRKMRRRNSKP